MQRRLDGFTMNELIGFGATGEVWRARPQAGGADVALKWLPAEAIDAEQLEASGLREFRHPHAARLLDIRHDGSSVVLVHEFILGVSLDALLAERERLSGSEAVTLLTPIAEALGAAHDAGLLHADLSPSAILLTPDGRPVITDLGIWQNLRTESKATRGPTRLEFLDPCVAGGDPPTQASDVFAVAAIGYYALTGRGPLAQGTGIDLAALHSSAGSRLVEVIVRGLSERPERRGGARHFALDVRDAAEPEPLHLAGPPVWPDLLPPSPDDVEATESAPARHGRPARHDSMDIADAVRRSRSARHASAVPTPRRPVVPRRTVVSALVGLAVLGVIVFGLGWNQSRAVPAQAGVPAARATTAAQAVDERAVPDSPVSWANLLTLLYQRRALAFGTGDASVLDEVFTPDSPQLITDRIEVTRLAEAGEVLRGFAPVVLEVLEISVVGEVATLRITDEFGDYETVPAADTQGAALADHAGRGPAAVDLTMVLTAQGWRVRTAQLAG